MSLPAAAREPLVWALDEYFENDNDDPDAETLADVFVRLLAGALEEAGVEDPDEAIAALEEDQDLDEPLSELLAAELASHDDLDLTGEDVVRFVEKLGLLDWSGGGDLDEDDD